MTQKITYQFKMPIQHKGEWIDEIIVHAPTLRDLKALDGVTGTFTRAAKMIELLTGLTAREVEAISLEDMRGLGEITRPFFTALQPAATS
jgi:hypothetical protein